jgi:hypothetical protein
MMANEPLSDARLKAIRSTIMQALVIADSDFVENRARIALDELLAALMRLRTENAALHLDNTEGRWAKGKVDQLHLELAHQDAEIERLRAENAAMRPIVAAVATEDTIAHMGEDGDIYACIFCTGKDDRKHSKPSTVFKFFIHAPDCIVLPARAFDAAHAHSGETGEE